MYGVVTSTFFVVARIQAQRVDVWQNLNSTLTSMCYTHAMHKQTTRALFAILTLLLPPQLLYEVRAAYILNNKPHSTLE
jgi:hypothetical protein